MAESGMNPQHELKKMKEQLSANKERKAKLITQFSIPKDLQNLIKITEAFTAMQDMRKKYVLISSHYQRKFFEEVGKRIGVPKEEMEYTIYPELKEMLLEKKIDREKLRQRKRHCLCIQTKEGHWVLEGKIVDDLFEQLFLVKETVSEIRGLIASSGKACGPVRIIQKVHDFLNMQEGDILVTSMTRPEFAPIMKKAAAIVTDEGGITSHAAIVSRELVKPCIIGTKIATKVLKNGQRVEVDATKGIVRILA